MTNRTITLRNGNSTTTTPPRKTLKRNTVGRPRASVVALDAEATILTGALNLFAELGFAAVSTKEIAAAAGLNTALIYYYFGSKEELFRRCVMRAATEAGTLFAQLPQRELSAEAEVTAWLACHQNGFRTVERLLRISMSYSATAVKEPNVDTAIQGFHDVSRGVLDNALRRGLANREFSDIDVEESVALTTLVLDGVYVRAILFPGYDHSDDIAKLRSFVKARLHVSTS